MKMTKEIAIRYCDEYLARHISDIDKEFLEIAKEALQQEPCEPVRNPDQLDCVSKKGVAEVLLKYAHDEVGKAFAEFLVSQINDLPPVNPQKPCDKCVYSTSEGCQYNDITETIPPFETSDDAIRRQAVLDAINTDFHEDLSQLEDAIKALPVVEPKTGWIPVSKRLPEDFGTYLITLEGGDVCKCEFNPDFIDEEHENGAFTYYHQYFDQATLGMIDEEEEAVDAIAWMPFEPYKAEGSEE